jgi:hypothetical protein
VEDGETNVRRDSYPIQRSIAQDAQGRGNAQLIPMGTEGLLKFLRELVIEAEWRIARSKAEIAAYEQAIEAIERQEREAMTGVAEKPTRDERT